MLCSIGGAVGLVVVDSMAVLGRVNMVGDGGGSGAGCGVDVVRLVWGISRLADVVVVVVVVAMPV